MEKSSKPATKSEILSNIAEATKLPRTQVASVLDALSGQIKVAFGVDCMIACDGTKCVVMADVEDKEKMDALVTAHKAQATERPMPSGHVVFQIPVGESKWERYREMVPFQYRLKQVPTITVSNVIISGAADLQIEDVTVSQFIFSVKAIGRGEQLGPNGVEFDWEVAP